MLRQDPVFVRWLVQSLDHVDEEKVTWAEFMNWLAKEGAVRGVANDQRLYAFTLTRLVGEASHPLKYEPA